jgi:type I restriction enzyme S subunit
MQPNLSKGSAKIRLSETNDNLEAMAKQLYDYWFVQFDFPNEEGKPYKSSGGAMVWNEKLKREIPSCFEVVNMGKLCDFRNGINYSKDETGNDYQIVNVRNISSSRILLDGEDFDVITVPTSKAENYVLKPDDIIIARSGCPGSTRLLLSSANTLFCGFIICCSPNDSSMRNYLVYCLKQLEGTNATSSGGSILQNVSQDTLKGLHVIVPKKQIIDKFNKTIELIFARMLNCLKESKALTKQRDELLLLLMNGQASVNSD